MLLTIVYTISMPGTEEVTTESLSSPKMVKTTRRVLPELPITEPPSQKVISKKRGLYRVYQVIWYVLTVIEIILGFRVFLKFLGANPTSGFAHFIYVISAPFADPFAGIFQSTLLSDTALIEWSTFFAMGVYALTAYILTALIPIIKPVSTEEVEHTMDNK